MIITIPKHPIVGGSYFRMYQPLLALAKQGRIQLLSAGNDDDIMDAVAGSDIFFSPSAGFLAGYTQAKFIKEHIPTCKLVVDYDDCPLDLVPSELPAYVWAGTKECKVDKGCVPEWKKGTEVLLDGNACQFDIERNKLHTDYQLEIFKMADGIFTTTDYLAKKISKRGGENIKILPNFVVPELYNPIPDNDKKRLRIGWIFSSSHIGDYLRLKESIEQVVSDEDVELVIMTNMPLGKMNLSEDKYIIFPGVAMGKQYFNFVRNMDLDIGIAHVMDREFDLCKSPLKWQEYTAMGVSTIASKNLYGDYIEDGVDGMLYDNKKDFRRKLRLLIRDAKLRKSCVENATKKINKTLNPDLILDKYMNSFEEVLNA